VDSTPAEYRLLAVILQFANAKCHVPLAYVYYRQVNWRPRRYTLGDHEFANRLHGLRELPIESSEFLDLLSAVGYARTNSFYQ
jgi:hypothetical protein